MKPQHIHVVLSQLNIDEANFTIKDNKDVENEAYYYCNLDDNEFQFGSMSNILTNYTMDCRKLETCDNDCQNCQIE